MLDGNDLPRELLLTTRQKIELRNAFNISTDLKLSKTQISKLIQSGGFSGSLLSKLDESSCSFGKNDFSSIRNYRCRFSNRCRNSKEKFMVLEQRL